MTINYNAIANNTAPGSSSESGIQNVRTFTVFNSLLLPPAGKKVYSDNSCGMSVQTLDPRLGQLQNNGGNTWMPTLAFD